MTKATTNMESRQRYTLMDVYNAAKYEKNFNYTFWIHITLDILGENAMRFAGFSLVLVATVLIAIISILGFFIVLPSLFAPGSLALTVHVIWGLLLVFSIYFHYFMAVFTKPGSPKDDISNLNGSTSSGLICEDPEAQNESHYKLCKRCNYIKPRRTHHCSICNTCVLKMDHHCPWVSNCVGYRNYRYFASFLFWVTVATAYVSIISGVSLWQRGSLLFPSDGRTPFQSAVNAFFGSSEQNIYLQLYELLSHNDHAHKRSKRKHFFNEKSEDTTETDAITNTSTEPERRLEGDTYINVSQLPTPSSGSETAGIVEKVLHVDESQYITIPRSEDQMGVSAQANRQLDIAIEPEDVTHLSSAYKAHNNMRVIRGVGSISVLSTLLWLAPRNLLIFIAFMLAFGVCVGAGSLLCFHIFLIRNGYTTIEFFESDLLAKQCKQAGVPYKHPFDRGIVLNFAEVFGDLPIILALLPSTRPPPIVVFPPEEEMCLQIATSPSSLRSSEGKLGSTSTLKGSFEGGSGVSRRPLWENNNCNSSKESNCDIEQSKQQGMDRKSE